MRREIQEASLTKTHSERWQAMVIESALKDFNNKVDQLKTDRQKTYGVDLTSISKDEFDTFTDECLAELSEDPLFSFCQKHCIMDVSNIFQMVEYLRSGLVSLPIELFPLNQSAS